MVLDQQICKMKSRRGPASKFLVNRNVTIEKISKRNGENINNFFNNIEFELFI